MTFLPLSRIPTVMSINWVSRKIAGTVCPSYGSTRLIRRLLTWQIIEVRGGSFGYRLSSTTAYLTCTDFWQLEVRWCKICDFTSRLMPFFFVILYGGWVLTSPTRIIPNLLALTLQKHHRESKQLPCPNTHHQHHIKYYADKLFVKPTRQVKQKTQYFLPILSETI